MADGWIEVVNWDRFQHYRDRRPSWIKLYPALLDDDAFLSLPETQQALLVKLWMLYAKTGRKVPETTSKLSRSVGQRVTKRMLDSLSDAGWIRISASEPLAERYARDRDRDIGTVTRGGLASGEKPLDAFRDELSISENVRSEIGALRLLDEIDDADARTAAALRLFERRLPEAAFGQALDALRDRRARPGKPLASEARYVVATLTTIEQERLNGS